MIFKGLLRNARDIEEIWCRCKIKETRNENRRLVVVKRTILDHEYGSCGDMFTSRLFSAFRPDLLLGLSVNRSATVSPDVPPPTMIKS